MVLKPKKFFSETKKVTNEPIKSKTSDIVKSEIFIICISFALPFIIAVLFGFFGTKSFDEVFKYAYKYAIIGGVDLFVFNAIFIFYIYGHRINKDFLKEFCMICVSIVITFFFATVLSAYISVFIAPICVGGLLIALLINRKLAVYCNTLTVILFFFIYYLIYGDITPISMFCAILTQVVSGCFLILISKKTYTRLSFIAKSLIFGIALSFPLAFISSMAEPDWNVIESLKIGLWSCLSIITGLAIFMIILPLFEFLFRLYSNFRLDELCTPDSELMARLAKEAPGTYNHSLAMANLAQACAMAIGENATLARAGACYHDVGKLRNPICFTENQTDYNPHDDFIPEVSVSLITRHTHDGAEIIRKAGLPEELARIAEEHHGQQTVGFFLNKTRGITDEQINKSDFSYTGPKPSTKISGLIMIVDTVEAATRAQGIDKDEHNFKAFIHKLIFDKMDSGQFTDCPLTLLELQVIEDTLVKTLPKLYHQRIKYTK